MTQAQDRVWVAPGQPAVVMITAKLDGAPVSVQFDSAQLVRHLDGQPDAVVGTVGFTDSGSAPDQFASDGTYTGVVTTPTRRHGREPDPDRAHAGGRRVGDLIFQFVQTASAPAVFTQTARDALEQGSVAIYVGIQVQKAGVYEIQGRLYDSGGAPIAYMRFYDSADEDSTEVRLLAYGKVILDEGACRLLRDVEGWRMVVGKYPDRELMTYWPAGVHHRQVQELSQLTGADYDGADKQLRLQQFGRTEQNGLERTSTTTSPAPGVPTVPGEAQGVAPALRRRRRHRRARHPPSRRRTEPKRSVKRLGHVADEQDSSTSAPKATPRADRTMEKRARFRATSAEPARCASAAFRARKSRARRTGRRGRGPSRRARRRERGRADGLRDASLLTHGSSVAEDSSPDRAEPLVVDVARDGRLRSADRAVGSRRSLQLAELHLQTVVREQSPDERSSLAEQQLDRLGRLERPDDAAEDAEHARLLAARREVRRRRLRVKAAVARARRRCRAPSRPCPE